MILSILYIFQKWWGIMHEVSLHLYDRLWSQLPNRFSFNDEKYSDLEPCPEKKNFVFFLDKSHHGLKSRYRCIQRYMRILIFKPVAKGGIWRISCTASSSGWVWSKIQFLCKALVLSFIYTQKLNYFIHRARRTVHLKFESTHFHWFSMYFLT